MRLSAALAVAGLVLLLWSFLPSSSASPDQASGSTATATIIASDASMGRALFSAKGCATCHINRRIVNGTGDCCAGVGPDLTTYTNDPAFLRRWLAEPASVRPTTTMPDLDLSSDEIEDLIAFLNEPR
jgi:cytochrome c2